MLHEVDYPELLYIIAQYRGMPNADDNGFLEPLLEDIKLEKDELVAWLTLQNPSRYNMLYLWKERHSLYIRELLQFDETLMSFFENALLYYELDLMELCHTDDGVRLVPVRVFPSIPTDEITELFGEMISAVGRSYRQNRAPLPPLAPVNATGENE